MTSLHPLAFLPRCGSAPLLAVALVVAWAHALDLRGYVLGCGRAAAERAP